jgi:imidazolonepropionase-like amidohydrolase
MTLRRLFLALLILLGGSFAGPGPLAARQDAPVTIRAARLFDGRGQLATNRVIEVRGSTIAAVDARTGPVTHDLGDVTLLPGFIDVHTHVDWHFQPSGRYGRREGDPPETPEQARAAIARNLEATLLAGFTTVQNVGSRGDAELRAAVAGGTLAGPRILTSLGQVQGSRRGTPVSPDMLREQVRALEAAGADVIKIFASESIRSGGAPTMTQEQLDAACGEARAQGLRTLVHAHASEAIIRAVRAGCTQVEHGAYADDEALALMRDRGVFFDPNIGLVLQNYIENKDRFMGSGNYTEEGFAFMERSVGVKGEMFDRAIRSGVKMPLGTDAVAGAHGQNAREIVVRVETGQPARDALISATSLAAESLGLGSTIGTLAPGFEADIIAVGGNPLEDITKTRDVRFVMKGGTVFKVN